MAVSRIGAGWGAEAATSLRMARYWPEGCGFHKQWWGRPGLSPGLPKSKTLVWVLKQELRLEILQRIPPLVGRCLGAGCVGEEHDFLSFSFWTKNIYSCRYLLLICGQS